MRISPKARMNRLFTNGRCLDVAIDHGVCNEPTFMVGLEDMAGVVDQLIAAGPDAIQMNYGQADLLQSRPGEGQAGAGHAHRHGQSLQRPAPPRDVGRCCRTTTSRSSARSRWMRPASWSTCSCCRTSRSCSASASPTSPRSARPARKYGMPLMIEPLVMLPNDVRGGYQVDGDAEKIVTLVRLAAEMGADIIKADPTDRPGGLPPRRRGGARAGAGARRRQGGPAHGASASRRRCSRRARRAWSTAATSTSTTTRRRVVAALMAMIHQRRLGRRGLGDLPAMAERATSCSASTPATPSSRRCCSTAPAASSRRAQRDGALARRRRPAMSSATWRSSGPTPPTVIRDCLDKAGVDAARRSRRSAAPAMATASTSSTAPARRCSAIQSLDSRAAALAEELGADGNGARLHAICLQEPWPSQTPTLLAWVQPPRARDLCARRHGLLLQGLRHLPPDRARGSRDISDMTRRRLRCACPSAATTTTCSRATASPTRAPLLPDARRADRHRRPRHRRGRRRDRPGRGHAGRRRPVRRGGERARLGRRRRGAGLDHRRHLEHQPGHRRARRSSTRASSWSSAFGRGPRSWRSNRAPPRPPTSNGTCASSSSAAAITTIRSAPAIAASAAVAPGRGRPLLPPLPLRLARRAPTMRAGFYGVAGWHGEGHLLRALFEGVAFEHRRHIDVLRAAGIRFDSADRSRAAARAARSGRRCSPTSSASRSRSPPAPRPARSAPRSPPGVGAGVFADLAAGVRRDDRGAARASRPTPPWPAHYDERYRTYRHAHRGDEAGLAADGRGAGGGVTRWTATGDRRAATTTSSSAPAPPAACSPTG